MNRKITYKEVTLAIGILVAVLVSLMILVNPARQSNHIHLTHFSLPVIENAIKVAGDISLD